MSKKKKKKDGIMVLSPVRVCLAWVTVPVLGQDDRRLEQRVPDDDDVGARDVRPHRGRRGHYTYSLT